MRRFFFLQDKYLILIILVFISLFLLFFKPCFDKDAFAYYSFLRTIYFDGDLNLYNEFLFGEAESVAWVHGPGSGGITISGKALKRGYKSHILSIGTSLFLFPFIVLGDLFARLSHFFGHGYALHGYSFPYRMSIGLGSVFYSLIAILLIYELLKKFFSRSLSTFVTLCLMLGSSFIALAFIHPGFKHPISMALSAIFCLVLVEKKDQIFQSKTISFFMGLLVGVMVLVRIQIGYLIIFIGIWYLIEAILDRSRILVYIQNISILFIGFLLGFLPQLITWHILYGTYLTIPYEKARFSLCNPQILDLLFGFRHGFFGWTPILLPAFLGLLIFIRLNRAIGLFFIFVAGFHIYNSSIYSGRIGDIFGNRRFMDLYPLLALGLASLIDIARKRNKWAHSFVIFSCIAFVFITLLLAPLYYRGEPRNYVLSIAYLFIYFPVSIVKIAMTFKDSYFIKAMYGHKDTGLFQEFLLPLFIFVFTIFLAIIIAKWLTGIITKIQHRRFNIVFAGGCVMASLYLGYMGVNVHTVTTLDLSKKDTNHRVDKRVINRKGAYQAEAWSYKINPGKLISTDLNTSISAGSMTLIGSIIDIDKLDKDTEGLQIVIFSDMEEQINCFIPSRYFIEKDLPIQVEELPLVSNIEYFQFPYDNDYITFAYINVVFPGRIKIHRIDFLNNMNRSSVILKGIAFE